MRTNQVQGHPTLTLALGRRPWASALYLGLADCTLLNTFLIYFNTAFLNKSHSGQLWPSFPAVQCGVVTTDVYLSSFSRWDFC